MKKITGFLIGVLLAAGLSPLPALSQGESYVTGRITGTHRPLPGYFYNNMRLSAMGIDRVEFTGFRLLRVEDGKSFLIRPNHDGYFYQDLPGGEYTLTRKRTDRPGYREPKSIDILRFEVEPGSLVNLGTINLLLDGEPRESLFTRAESTRGRYTYSYRYERDSGDGAFDDPLEWFTGRKPAAAAKLGDRTFRVDTRPTLDKDGSKVTLRENLRVPGD